MLAALEAQQMLLDEHGVAAEVWSATSYKALRDEALAVERQNRLHPGDQRDVPHVERVLASGSGPVVAVTDHVTLVADQVARWMPRPFLSLGTDGFGLSDTRPALRRHFETDAVHIVVAVLSGLTQQGDINEATVAAAVSRYGIDAHAPDPWTV
jgi:pyruvate dehydrogenase E1 component